MDGSLIDVLVVEGLAIVAGVAASAARIAGLSRRVATLERAREALGKDFVPRLELQAVLESIRETTSRSHGLLRALIQTGARGLDIKAIEAAADAGTGSNHFAYGDKGLALTKSFERLELHAYPDSGGTWTIGWGHTGKDVHSGLLITEAEAEHLLLSDLATAVACVNASVNAPISQNEFDALVDFTFNEGRASFLHSSLLRTVNAGSMRCAAPRFAEWVYCDGKVSDGLVRRRKAEIALFLEVA